MRALYAARLGYTPQAPPAVLQAAFDKGHELEESILAKVHNDYHWTLDGFQQPVEMHVGTNEAGQELYLVGHVDCVGQPPGGPHYMPVDAKAFAQSTMDNFNRHGIGSFPHYSWQGCSYAVCLGIEKFALALFNKDTEELEIRVFDTNELGIGYDTIQNRIFQVELYAQQQLDVTAIECPGDFGCKFAYLHDVKENGEIPDEIIALARNYHTVNEKIKAYEGVKKILAGQVIEGLPYTDDLRTFRGDGLTVTVKSNGGRLDQQKIRALLTEAELDIQEYWVEGEGVHIVVKEKP